MADVDKQAQRARAQRLREQIEELKQGTAEPPQNPNEFIHRRMDELSQNGDNPKMDDQPQPPQQSADA